MLRDLFRKIRRPLARVRLDQHIFISLVAIFIGLLAGYGAVLFKFSIKAAQHLFYGTSEDILAFAHLVPIPLKILLPAIGGLIVGPIIYFGAHEAKGHGVPEVMEAIALKGGHIRKRVAFVKIVASAISIGSGGSVGREGPIVQIGASIASTVGQYLKMPHNLQRTLVGCGAAAGITATFNAPIAGVLFAVEVILGDFGLATFSPIVLSSVTATTVSRQYFGSFPSFQAPTYHLISLWEFALYPVLGIICGFIALLFIFTLYKSEDYFEALKIPEYLKPALGGLLAGIIIVKFPHVFGVGYGSINLAIRDKLPLLLMFLLIFMKLFATAFTIGGGASGGIFTPSLFIGATAGGTFGYLVHTLFPHITSTPGAYALVGMGALVAGTTHAPITAILIIFELTGDYKIILPLMAACIIATIISTSLKRGSIYTLKLLRRGVEISRGWEQSILMTLMVKDIMDDNVITIPESMYLRDILNTFKSSDVSYLHVVNDQGELTGIISFRDIRGILQEEALRNLIVAKDVATTEVITLRPMDTLQTAMRLMGARDISQLPVVSDETNRKVIGTITKRDVMAAYDRAIIRREIDRG